MRRSQHGMAWHASSQIPPLSLSPLLVKKFLKFLSSHTSIDQPIKSIYLSIGQKVLSANETDPVNPIQPIHQIKTIKSKPSKSLSGCAKSVPTQSTQTARCLLYLHQVLHMIPHRTSRDLIGQGRSIGVSVTDSIERRQKKNKKGQEEDHQ